MPQQFLCFSADHADARGRRFRSVSKIQLPTPVAVDSPSRLHVVEAALGLLSLSRAPFQTWSRSKAARRSYSREGRSRSSPSR